MEPSEIRKLEIRVLSGELTLSDALWQAYKLGADSTRRDDSKVYEDFLASQRD